MSSLIKKTIKSLLSYCGYKIIKIDDQRIRETPWGFKLAGHKDMAAGNFEPEETRLVRDLLKEVDILLNVGANVGYYCCHALSLEKPVIAVEPNISNLQYLLRNIAENGWAKHADIFPVAIGSESDILQMWGGGTGASLIKGWAGASESYFNHVPVLTLDRILGRSLCRKRALILVDIEGYEYSMLQGAMATLSHIPRPIWIIEIASTEHQPDGLDINPNFAETFELFFEHGYSAFTADINQTQIDLSLVQNIANGNSLKPSNNFLFR